MRRKMLLLIFFISFLSGLIEIYKPRATKTEWTAPCACCREGENHSEACWNNDTDFGKYVLREPCDSQKHLFYLRTMKTASTSFVNILFRFALANDLRVLQFQDWRVFKKELLVNETLDSIFYGVKHGFRQRYDMAMEHIIFDKTFLRKVLPQGTMFVSSVRDPWSRLNSHLDFFTGIKIYPAWAGILKLNRSLRVPLNVQFMQNLERYGNGYEKSFQSEMGVFSLRNQVSKQFGAFKGLQVGAFLDQIKRDFPLIIVKEYFDESLVLLKRKLCWSTKDILYAKLRQSKRNSKVDQKYSEFEEMFRQWSGADYRLYRLFNETLRKEIKQQKFFWKELKYFKHINALVNKWCKTEVFSFIHRNANETGKILLSRETLVIPETRFNERVVVDKRECLLMRTDCNIWRNIFRFRQFPQLCHILEKGKSWSLKTFNLVSKNKLWASENYCDAPPEKSLGKIPLSVFRRKDFL